MKWVLRYCEEPHCADGIIPGKCDCPSACDHDTLCPRCHGTSYEPVPADFFDLLDGSDIFKTAAKALAAAIEQI